MSHGGAGVNLTLASIVKEAVSVPVITVGNSTPPSARRRSGKARPISSP